MIRSFCETIGFPEDAIICMEQTYSAMRKDSDVMHLICQAMDLVYLQDTKDFVTILNIISDKTGICRYTSDMVFWILCAKPLQYVYRSHNLPDSMYWDAMNDLKYKVMECHAFCGIWGTLSTWYAPFFTLNRFAFGRLQYDKWTWPFESYRGVLKTGDAAYRIHIPAAGPLTPESVYDSFRRLHGFVKDSHEGGIVPIACVTWLLYPPMIKLYPDDSNIRKFYQMFDMISDRVDESFSAFRWLYNMEYKGPETFAHVPTDTRLRKNAKEYFEAGGKMGTGTGIALFDGEKIINI